jgi:hypothetical protein
VPCVQGASCEHAAWYHTVVRGGKFRGARWVSHSTAQASGSLSGAAVYIGSLCSEQSCVYIDVCVCLWGWPPYFVAWYDDVQHAPQLMKALYKERCVRYHFCRVELGAGLCRCVPAVTVSMVVWLQHVS